MPFHPHRRAHAALTLATLLCGLATLAPARAQPAADTGAAASATIGARELPIHDSARLGTLQDMQRALQAAPAQRDARTPLGATPLHYAALNVDVGPLRALLAAGANPNARDAEGRTPLHMAAFGTRTEHARLLLRAGADPLLKTDGGRDVLSMARKVRADELAGEISLWILKGCSKDKPC